ncbi:hypothetical protein [Nonomuraea sp. NPDC049480]|uniref:hypothetical protein n=1 Tax=Nonomuraea sp. NPDC049480 TaxID=3364353 RepID=UPI00378CB50C
MRPDKRSVSPFYDGFALMGTPWSKTFTRSWNGRPGAVGGAGSAGSGRLTATITLRDHLYVIVISRRKKLGENARLLLDETRSDRAAYVGIAGNCSDLPWDRFASPLPGSGEVMKAFF